MLTIKELQGDLLVVEASGKLTKADYDGFVPRFEKIVEAQRPLRILMDLQDFHGWDLPALWEELKFDIGHREDLGRVAIVADKAWQKWGTRLSKPFFKAEIREFEHGQEQEARTWLAQG